MELLLGKVEKVELCGGFKTSGEQFPHTRLKKYSTLSFGVRNFGKSGVCCVRKWKSGVLARLKKTTPHYLLGVSNCGKKWSLLHERKWSCVEVSRQVESDSHFLGLTKYSTLSVGGCNY